MLSENISKKISKKIGIAIAGLVVIAAAVFGIRHFHQSPSTGVASGGKQATSAVAADDVDPNTPFDWVEADNRSFEGSPALALTVTQPLDKKQKFDALIQVFEMGSVAVTQTNNNNDEDQEQGGPPVEKSVSLADKDVDIKGGKLVPSSWVTGSNPRILYLPNVKPTTRYVVVIKPGIKDASGRSIDKEQRYSISTAAIAPAYYFASNGMVLPAAQNGGLPVVTVNIPEVDVEFLKVKKEQLPRFLDMVMNGPSKKARRNIDDENDEAAQEWNKPYDQRHHELHGAVNGWELDPLHKMTDSVYHGRFVTEKQSNKQSVTFVPVEDIKELREPGIYVAVMTQPGRFRYDYQTTYFYVSDLGLSMHVYPKSASALVSSLTTGKPISGTTISWLDADGKVLAQKTTDGDGRADFDNHPDKARLLLAEHGSEISVLALKEPALDLSEYEIGGDLYKPVRLFAYSGRDLYRPGERFNLSVLARDADGQPVPPQPIQAILRRPDGKSQLVAMLKPDAKLPGYFQQRIEIPVDAPTGAWTVQLRSDPADHSANTTYRFSVEEFLPERMKLELSADAPLLHQNSEFRIAVNGSYLYGAPAAGNRLLGAVEYTRSKNPLADKLPGYVFGSVDDDNVAARKELPESKLDEQGKATVEVDTEPAQGRKSPIKIRSTLSLLETGGRPVIRSLERVVWPSNTLYGVRPKFSNEYVAEGALAEFDVILADEQAHMLAERGVPVRLIRENRNWYWRFDDQRGWNSGFAETSELIATKSLDLAAGQTAALKMQVQYGRYRLEVGTPGQPGSLVYRFFAGWSAERDQSEGVRPDRVSLKLDKPNYAEGETAHLAIAAPHKGEAIVAVEGDRLLWMKRISISGDDDKIDIPIDKSWKRQDMYVSVTVLRPGNQGDLITPTRALGLIHLGIDRKARKLNVSIDAPERIEPDTTVPVTIKTNAVGAQTAFVTLSAVDEGILNITEFKTPDPFQAFFGQLRFGADLRDMYGRLIEKMAGKKGSLRYGGDTSLNKPARSSEKVRLVDLFSGPVRLDAQGKAVIQLKVPDFNGRLRLMAMAASPDHFSAAERSMVVAAPVIAEMNTPRFIAIGDTATLGLDVHNLSGSTQTLKLDVTAGAGLTLAGGSQSVTLKDREKTTLRFKVSAGGPLGLADLQVKVKGDKINIDRHFALEVEAPTPTRQVNTTFVLAPGESVTLRNADSAAWYPGRKSQLMLSALPPLNAQQMLQGLLVYPYGCAEQTTSSSYPWVYVDEEAARRYNLPVHSREERSAVLDKSFAKLGAYQAPNGGFSLWGNANEFDYWLSAYVTHFLQDARTERFAVPDAMYNKAIAFLQEQLPAGIASLPAKPNAWNGSNNWNDYWNQRNRNFEALAFGALVLAEDRKVQLASLRQLYELRANAISGLSLIELGIALDRMGDAPRGKTAIEEGLAKPRISSSFWFDYGSPVRDSALAYALLQQYKLGSPRDGALLGTIVEGLKTRNYLSTEDQMAVFLAARYVDTQAGNTWSASLAGDKAADALTGTSSRFVSLPNADGIGHKLQNTGTAPLFAVMTSTGNPKAVGDSYPGMKIFRKMFTVDGKPLPDNPTLKVGDSVWVEITGNASFFTPNGLVVDRLPAGLEIENTHLIQGESGDALKIDGVNPAEAMQDQRIDHVEFRDDRFVAAVRLGSWWDNDLHLFYRARVVTPGRFVLPQSSVEDMYDPRLHAVSKEPLTVTVEDAGLPKKAAVKSESDTIPQATTP
ncbi:uncharacterized protein YfaS (alpha-2-macroglobulin family) [Oxalobacteraceae bacterium GrIS 2.11]